VTLTFTPAPGKMALIHGDAEVARQLLRRQRGTVALSDRG
jgi:hypothetical protein